MPKKLDAANQLRRAMEMFAKTLNDANASEVPLLFPALKHDGNLITAGTRINWKGTIKKAAVDLWDTEGNNPDNAPSLWADLSYRDGIRIIPETITTSLAFSEGELGRWGDVIYRSKVDANVYTPAQYAGNWEIVEQ